MQRYILSQKNKIAFISGILIFIGFLNRFTFNNTEVYHWALILATIIGIGPIALQAYQALRLRIVSIDLLVTIAVLGAVLIKNYEESAIVSFLFLFGSYLEQRTLNKTRSAIKELTDLAPETALKKIGQDEFVEVDIFDLDPGDILLVKTGSYIPVDGIVTSGEGHVNEASITGESVPVSKKLAEEVFAGTLLENGTLQVRVERVGEDTTFGKIIELVEDAQDSKSAAERFIDRFAKYYTPAVLIFGVFIWIFTRDIEMAITALVLGCPGALVIGVPVSNVSGIGNGARHGILLKGSEVVTDFSKVDTIIFDKTGTLTLGNPEVSHFTYYGENKNYDLSLLASLERESDHPLAKAILDYIGDVDIKEVKHTEVIKGGGITARVDQQAIIVGNPALMKQKKVRLTEDMNQAIKDLERSGHSLVLMAVNGHLKIITGIRDQIRPAVKDHLKSFKALGIENLVVLSGDNQGTVDLVAKELGLSEAYGHMLPEDKSAYIETLQAKGQIVAFVGDGINDSPSLARANIGIAMGSGTDVAIETSDVVLMNSDFGHLSHALGLTRAMTRNMKQNIIIAISVVILLLSGLLFSDWMNMSIGMLAHEASIFLVIINGMRLLGYRLKNFDKIDQHQF